MIEWECEMGLEGLKFKDYLMPINQINSQHLLSRKMADGSSTQPFVTVKDYENWLKRLNQYLDWCDRIINMKIGMAQELSSRKFLQRKQFSV